LETNYLNKRFIWLVTLCSSLLFGFSVGAVQPSSLYSDESEEIDVIGLRDIKGAQKNPVKDVVFFYEKRISLENGSVVEPLNIKSQTENSLQKQQVRGLYLGANEFIEIKGVDNRRQLFNGSVILKFSELPDFVQFASSYGLVFVADLSDISRGVFKVENLYELDQKVTELALDKNIISIELDTIDPTVRVN
jgi:hypothetical protein